MAKKAVKKTTARKTSASSKVAKKKASKSPASKSSADDKDADFLAGLAVDDGAPASEAVSLEQPEPGKSVSNCTRLPGGILLQWGRSCAPTFGAADSRVEFPKPFSGVPAVTSSFLYGKPMSASDRYLLEVDDEGFNWRNINPIGELMWIAVGAEG